MKKMTVAIITLIFTLISLNFFMDTLPGTAFAANEGPEEYVVEKADNLWDISDRKLQDHFLWPRVWNVNPHIENPNLIYPGTIIIIPSREELLAIPMRRKMPLSILKPKTLKPLPKLVFEFSDEALNKYIIEKNDFIRSGWIDPEFPGIGKILFSEKDSVLLDKGDIVYLETSGRSKPGSTYFTIKSVKEVKHPVTTEKMGQQIAITGSLEIIGSDDNILKARILTTFDDISVGDGILPFKKIEPPLIVANPRTPDITGYIVESRINATISSRGNIIFLDKGSDDGVEVGDVFQAISEQPIRRPIGKLQIIRTKPDTATAVIIDGAREVTIGDAFAQK